MTETEWLECAAVHPMLHFLRYEAPAGPGRCRKYRLFACASAQRATSGDIDGEAIAVAERWADRQVDAVELQVARNCGVRGLARKTLLRSARMAATDIAYAQGNDPLLPALLRDVMGNPFRPSQFAASWRTSDVMALASRFYKDRAFDRLPQLIVALEDAGCEDERILAHCRMDSPHIRGCWVVDLVLGLAGAS